MVREKQTKRLLMIIIPLVIISLACDLDLLNHSPFGEKKYPSPVSTLEMSSRSLTYTGEGTTSWSWNHGGATCNTPAQVTLTIKGYDAVLESVGACVDPVVPKDYSNSGQCYEPKPGEHCGNTFKGKVVPDVNFKVVFSSCTAGKAEGAAIAICDANKCDFTGSATCGTVGEDPWIVNFKLEGQAK